jgi:hypothetical protein
LILNMQSLQILPQALPRLFSTAWGLNTFLFPVITWASCEVVSGTT